MAEKNQNQDLKEKLIKENRITLDNIISYCSYFIKEEKKVAEQLGIKENENLVIIAGDLIVKARMLKKLQEEGIKLDERVRVLISPVDLKISFKDGEKVTPEQVAALATEIVKEELRTSVDLEIPPRHDVILNGLGLILDNQIREYLNEMSSAQTGEHGKPLTGGLSYS